MTKRKHNENNDENNDNVNSEDNNDDYYSDCSDDSNYTESDTNDTDDMSEDDEDDELNDTEQNMDDAIRAFMNGIISGLNEVNTPNNDDNNDTNNTRRLRKRNRLNNSNNESIETIKTNNVINECRNPLCDHKKNDETCDISPNMNTIELDSINHITDLITLGKSYHCKRNKEYKGLNLRLLCNLIAPLTELNNMIGMDDVKEQIVNQILFFLQGNHTTNKCNKCIECALEMPCINSQTEMLHTVITGKPGIGKTEFGKILGKIYTEMGILSKGTFTIASRADLIANYLGQTATKTQKLIDSCTGGVLFIDEAYSLGSMSSNEDSYSKECIDTLNQNLTEKRDFLCIIAGYKDALDDCFFNVNEGLKRRFTFRYDMKTYNYYELLQIFELKIKQSEWSLWFDNTGDNACDSTNERNKIINFFKKNVNYFPNNGGDMETLLLNCKIYHSRKCFDNKTNRRTLSYDDIINGFNLFMKSRQYKEVHTPAILSMYI